MTPQRPALAEVLAAMTSESDASWWSMMTTDHETRAVAAGIEWRIADVWAPLRLWRREPETQRSPLRMTTPAEAVEALATARLWPWEPSDDPTRWWCERCEGGGSLNDGPGWPGLILCPACSTHSATDEIRIGTTAAPPSLAALVAVASLGAPQIARYVHLAGEIARAAGCAGARVVWRPMTREAIDAWVDGGAGRIVAEAPQTIPQAACVAATRWASVGWDSATPWWLNEAPATVAASWPAVRDIVAAGALPVDLDASRIILAVEAL